MKHEIGHLLPEACYGDQHGGKILTSPFQSMTVGTCRVCSIMVACEDDENIVIPMTEHVARIHPDSFEELAREIAKKTGIRQFDGMTAADYLTYREEDKFWERMEKQGGPTGLGGYL